MNGQSEKSSFIPRKYLIWGVVGTLLIGIIVIGVMLFMGRNFALQIDVIRDLFLIALALEACVIGIVMIVLLVMIVRLINTVEFEIKPILDKTNKLVGTATTTTEFVSDNIIQPTIKAKGAISGARAGAKALVSDPKKNLPK